MAISGAEIREVRERLGLTQDQFASLLGLHPYTIMRWEKGSFSPTAYQEELIRRFALAAPKAGGGALVAVLATAGAIAGLTILLMWAAGQDPKDKRRGPKPERRAPSKKKAP